MSRVYRVVKQCLQQDKGACAHAQVVPQGHACCMCRPVRQFHCARHQLITLSNQCWRSIIYYSLAHAHCMTVLIIAAHLLEYCFRTTSTERKQSSRMRVTRPSSRASAHVAAARPNIAQWATCRSACMIGSSENHWRRCIVSIGARIWKDIWTFP